MGKKHKHPEHENLERWLVSYADFITLLFATFVVLYALSQADLAKFKQAGESIKAAFSNNARGIMNQSDGIMEGQKDPRLLPKSGDSVLDRVNPKPAPTPPTSEGSVNPMAQSVQEINQEIQKMMRQGAGQGAGQGAAAEAAGGSAQLKIQERGIVISFSSNLFFEPGSAGIKPASFPVLDKVAQELKPLGRVIHVEGHTDNQPIFTAVYPSNWELSSARASSVIRYFIKKHQFEPGTLAAVGYGETRPLGDNKTTAGRAKNRRVDIVILFSSAVLEADAGAAQKSESIVVLSEESDPDGPVKTITHKNASPKQDDADLTKAINQDIKKVVIEDAQEAGLPTPTSKAPVAKPKAPTQNIKPAPTKVTLPAKPKVTHTTSTAKGKPRVVKEEESVGADNPLVKRTTPLPAKTPRVVKEHEAGHH